MCVHLSLYFILMDVWDVFDVIRLGVVGDVSMC